MQRSQQNDGICLKPLSPMLQHLLPHERGSYQNNNTHLRHRSELDFPRCSRQSVKQGLLVVVRAEVAQC
jgi:hypothetical protein